MYMHVLGVIKNLQLLRKIRTLVRIFFKDLKFVKQQFDDFIQILIITYKSTQLKKVTAQFCCEVLFQMEFDKEKSVSIFLISR